MRKLNRETLQRFTSGLHCVIHPYVNETKCPAENGPGRRVLFFRSALLVISKSTTWIYSQATFVREKIRSNRARQKRCNGRAMWRATTISLGFMYLSGDTRVVHRHSLAVQNPKRFPRNARDILGKLSEQCCRSVWILWRAKMHFPRRVI